MQTLKTIFGIDLRTLALVRVWLAVVIIADLLIRATEFSAHYTDAGAVPREALFILKDSVAASFHLTSGSAWITAVWFVIAGLVALALMFGYHSRMAAFLSWVLLISLDSRNQFVSQGGDMLLRQLMFWLIFLPIGARFSIDSALDKSPPEDTVHLSMASAGLLLQAMCVYFFTALLKSDPVWLQEGTAVYYALSNDALVLPFGEWLRQFPILMTGLTYFVWCLEIAAPFLMFSPFFHIYLRLGGLVALLGMHLGFFLSLDIALFPFISAASLLAFTPPLIWDWLDKKWAAPRRQAIRIFYDGECLFCEKTVLILRTFLILPHAEMEPAQSNPAAFALMQEHDTWVLYGADDKPHTSWAALVWLIGQSPLFGWLGWLLSGKIQVAAGERLYRVVAENRGQLSNMSRVFLPFRELVHQPTAIAQAVCAMFIVVMLWTNLNSLGIDGIRTPPVVRTVADSVRLGQKWSMFAPSPSKVSGWFVAVGATADGQTADVYTDKLAPPQWSRETYLGLNHDSYRWRKFLSRLPLEERSELRPFYLQYLCRDWNSRHAPDEQLEWIRLYFIAERTGAPGTPRAAKRSLIWKSDCGVDPVQEVLNLRQGILPDLN